MLGNTLGSRLATSPALATIARGETSGAVRDDLAKLFATLNQPPPKTTIVPPGGGTTQPRGGEPRVATTGAVRFVSSGATERVSALGASARRAIFEAPTTTGPTLAAPELELTASGFREVLAGARLKGGVADLIQTSGVTPDDVRDSTAIIGEDFRTVTIAERLAPPAATEVRSSAKATNYQSTKTLFDLSKLGLNLNDIQVHGFVSDNERTSRPFGELKEDDLKLLLEDPRPGDAVDEAVFFHDAAHVLEGHIATLRNLEARVAQYRELLRECKERLTALRAVESAIGARLEVVGQNVTEARHGVATARPLRAEELGRLERIVARRKAVLAQHVDVLAYVRPRYFDGLVAVPKVTLDPGLLDSPVPACLTGHDDAPTELTELVALLREAPLAWLRYAGSVLEPLNRVELLHRVVLTARTRVQAMQGLDATAPWVVAQPAGRFGKALATVGQAQVDAIWQQRSVVAELDLRQFVDRSWIESRDAARKLVSLGDVIEGSHGKSAAAAAALAELERIERVATCLWARVGEVLPVVRLAWAEALSQYEPGRSLRTLSALPRWRDVDFRLRHDIEVLAEWLLDRVDPENPAALAWMLDLVRVAILLASHAPVDAIVSGQVPTASPANVGALVPVMIDPARVRVGMHVTFFHGGAAVARGIVEDLVGQRARARIAEAVRADLRLEVGVQAQFTSELRALSLRG
nr:MAG: hypothetical protein DIU78_22190 [Pseudomonadota bacterium]